jgi:polyphosphate kinase
MYDSAKMNNRELSWLCFNERILQEARDPATPLVQRLRFLGIFSSNQDEFIRVRVAALVRLCRARDARRPVLMGGFSPQEALRRVNEKVAAGQAAFAATYAEVVKTLEEQGIRMRDESRLTTGQEIFCRAYFTDVIKPQLVPLILNRSARLPFLQDSHIYHAVKMCPTDKKKARYAILRIPVSAACPRFVELPSPSGCHDIIFVDDIIRLCLDNIFFMFSYTSIAAYTFKVMRDAELSLDDDVSKSLIEKMEEGLEHRLRGRPVRLIYDRGMPEDLLVLLTSKLSLKNSELDPGGRHHMMRSLMHFPRVRPDLESNVPPPLAHPDLKPFSSILRVVKKKDVLLHFPYHAFNHLVDFLGEAAIDPKVTAISITLYRTAEQSRVINALINAAQNGKRVTAFVELLARFDEERNVKTVDALRQGGVHIIHSLKDLKVHCKLVLVERAEGRCTRGYVYIGTGNFNEDTARLYSDVGLLTADSAFAEDARRIFSVLQASHKPLACTDLVVSPYNMRNFFRRLVEVEIKNAKAGLPAYIFLKLNSLTDEGMIRLLYKAGAAGVEVRLIVRGACCLKPQAQGLSENIWAVSIVDTFLEHARILIFCNNEEENVYISSADWMPRNLDRRIEVAAPVRCPQLARTLRDIFAIQWSDNVKARALDEGCCNRYHTGLTAVPCRSQTLIYDYYARKNLRRSAPAVQERASAAVRKRAASRKGARP